MAYPSQLLQNQRYTISVVLATKLNFAYASIPMLLVKNCITNYIIANCEI
jgi:hypothetical protein